MTTSDRPLSGGEPSAEVPTNRARPNRGDLEQFRDVTVDDLVGRCVRIAFVGINPGLWTAATRTHFAYPGNRFYPALEAAALGGPFDDPAAGLTPAEQESLVAEGIAITNLVARTTARADELTSEEIRAGGRDLEQRLRRWSPKVVVVLGLTAYRTAFRRPRAVRGLQPDTIGGVTTYVFGNPSGLNAHETVDSLAAAFREAAATAGVPTTGLRRTGGR